MNDLEKAMIKHYFDNVCAKLTLMVMLSHGMPCRCDLLDDKAVIHCVDSNYAPSTRYSYSDEKVDVDLYYWNKLRARADITIRYNTLDDLVANTKHAVAKLKLLLDTAHRDLYARNKQTQETRA